jgi:anti-sigma B factor antagonist
VPDDDYYSITREPGVGADGTSYFRVSGTLDIGARLDLREAFTDVVGQAGVTAIEVNLADVTFLDSEALAGLIEGFAAARQAGLRFAAVGAQGLVHRVLAVTGTLAFFTEGSPTHRPARVLRPGR